MAKLQSLGIAGMRPARGPANAPEPSSDNLFEYLKQHAKPQGRAGGRPDMTEYGASGTPIFGGFLRERGEYNPELQGLEAIQVYERMRRSDAQVAATLMAIKLPIRAAQWDVTVPDNATPVEKEAADFVHECLFEDLDFSGVLRNALLMLDFGVAAHEDVYEVVGNRVRLAKLAPRLPLTFYRWITDDTGEGLAALEQLGYRGSEYVCVQVPAQKLAIFTFEQEGQNYTGRSLLRQMYQHWYVKSNLYKIDAIAAERNGMGVPVVTMGPDPKTEDKTAAKAWVESLVAHQKTGLVLPPGWTFKLEGITGQVRDCKDSIAHHNTAISMAGLAQFMMLGQSEHGSHSLGATMADFFFMGLEAVSHQIARVLSLTTVKRLVDFNFEGVKNYPRVVPQQILTLKFAALVEALNKLATAGVVEPDDNLESWMREKMGAPEVDKATARAVPGPVTGKGLPQTGVAAGPQTAPSGVSSGNKVKPADGEQVVDAPAGGGDAGIDPGSTTDSPPVRQWSTSREIQDAANVLKQAMREAGMKVRLLDAGSVHVDGARGGGLKLKRAPRGAEKYLALSEIVSALDKGRDDTAAALRAARPRVQAEIIHKVMNRPVGQMHRASVEADGKLVAQVEQILRGVHDFGARQVGEERARQKAGAAPPDAAKIRMADARAKDPLGLYADGVVSEFTNTLSARATNAAIDRKRKGGTDGEIIQAVTSDLEDQSDKWIDGVAAKGANEAFAEGRQAGYEEYADEISQVIYSALLDLNTCEECAAADGQDGATPDDLPDVPNPDCDGGDKCRCVHVFVFSDEGQKAEE